MTAAQLLQWNDGVLSIDWRLVAVIGAATIIRWIIRR
jgi:hypothetical protein